MFYIYKVTSPSGKIYIGYTGETPKRRWYAHTKRARDGKLQRPLYRAIRKYGEKAFSIDTLAVCETEKEALVLERQYILELKAHIKNIGYNLSEGGVGDVAESRRRRRELANDPDWRQRHAANVAIAGKRRYAQMSEEQRQVARQQTMAARAAVDENRRLAALREALNNPEKEQKRIASIKAYWASNPEKYHEMIRKRSLTRMQRSAVKAGVSLKEWITLKNRKTQAGL